MTASTPLPPGDVGYEGLARLSSATSRAVWLDLGAGDHWFPASLFLFDEGVKFGAGVAYGQGSFMGEFLLDHAAAGRLDGLGFEFGQVGLGPFAGGQQTVPLRHFKAIEALFGHGRHIGQLGQSLA